MISRAMQVLNGTVAADTYSDDIRNRRHKWTNDIMFIQSFMELQRKKMEVDTFYQGKVVSLRKQCKGFEAITY